MNKLSLLSLLSLFMFGCLSSKKNESKTNKEKALEIFQKVKNINIDTFNKWDIEPRSKGALIMRYYFDSCRYKTYILKEDTKDSYLIKSINDKDSTFENLTSISKLNKEKFLFESDEFIKKYQLFYELHIERINWNCLNSRLFFRDDGDIIFYDFNVNEENNLGKNKIEGNWYY
ncbi:MAG TPA: hypothetical protein VFF27_16465 [Bacteroidia bacterium]|nr:hypothetical protein [Bacteroidia bacterium]